MEVVTFIWEAKFGHFLKAGANRNALTYPIPPKTAVIGLLGAILGIEKAQSQEVLTSLVSININGSPAQRFWHKGTWRKDPPLALPYTVTALMEGPKNPRPEKTTLINQEYLWKPSFIVSVALPDQDKVFNELVERLKNQRWHFSPVMGLSEMLAHLHYQDVVKATPLAEDNHEINSICPQYLGVLAPSTDAVVQLVRMPVNLTKERVFQHENVYFERSGKPFIVNTSNAFQVGNKKLVFF